jgi:hypothetical protein
MTSRRTALATAAAIVLTITTASFAVAANLGMFDDEEPVGQLTPVTGTSASDVAAARPTETPTIYVDEDGNVVPFVSDPAVAPERDAATTSAGDAPGGDGAVGDDDESGGEDHDRDEDEDDEDDDEHGDEHEEHEGRDDDD